MTTGKLNALPGNADVTYGIDGTYGATLVSQVPFVASVLRGSHSGDDHQRDTKHAVPVHRPLAVSPIRRLDPLRRGAPTWLRFWGYQGLRT